MRAHTWLRRAATAAILLPACAPRPPASAWPPLEHAELPDVHRDGRTRVRIVHDNGYVLMGDVPSLGWVFRRR